MEAHELTSELTTRWMNGEAIPGAAFRRSAHVRILEGPFADECGSVRSLLSLSPEACYCVVVDAAHVELEVGESALGTA